METTATEIGAIAFVLLTAVVLFIKGFWDYLKSKKGANGDLNQKILSELQLQNNNHLHTMQDCMDKGFTQMINKLDEIKEVLIRIDERSMLK